MAKWLKRNVQQQLGHKNLPAVTNKYDEEYKKHRNELIDGSLNNQIEDLFLMT